MRWLVAAVVLVAGCGDSGVAPDAAVHPDAPADASPALLSVTPTMTSYGGLCLGDTKASSFTIANAGGVAAPLELRIAGSNMESFEVTTGCGALASGATCTGTVAFHPDSPGGKTATLVVATPGSQVTASLDGSGLACSVLSVSPSPLSFGAIDVGSASAARRFTVDNTANGITLAPFEAMQLVGANPGDFEIIADTCSGVSLAPGAHCTVDVRFRPMAVGGRSALIDVRVPAGPLATVALSGTGAAVAQLTASPTICDFGVGCVPDVKTCSTTITNNGSAAATVALGVAGADASYFSIVGTPCTQSLSPGD